MSGKLFVYIAVYLVVVNAVAYLAFGLDKQLAKSGSRRISESTLLLLALIGGTPGAFAGRRTFRHKTVKQPFVRRLWLTAIFQVCLLVFLFIPPLRDEIISQVRSAIDRY